MAHTSGGWLHIPCHLGGVPNAFREGGTIRSRPEVGRVAIEALQPGGSPTPQSRAHNQQWPKIGPQLHNLCHRGVPNAKVRGAESEVAHNWARAFMTPVAPRIPNALERGEE